MPSYVSPQLRDIPNRKHPGKGRVWSCLCIQTNAHIVDFSEHSQIFQGYPRTVLNWQRSSESSHFFSNFPDKGLP